MNKIYVGNFNINKAYLGSDLTIKIYLGDNLVYPIEDSVAITFYDESGNTATINCDDLSQSGRIDYSDTESFRGTSYTSAVVGDCVTIIGGGSMPYQLTALTLSDSVEELEPNGSIPQNCVTLVCGTGLTTVGGYCMEYRTSIQSVTFNGTVPPAFNRNWESESNKTFIIYVPCNSIEAYRTALSGKTANLNDRLQCIPTVQNKWSLTFANGDVRSLECDASGDSFPRQIDDHDWIAPLTPFDATHAKSGVTSAVVGDCVTGLLNGSFDNFTSLSSITVDSDSIYVYGGYSGMTPTGYGPFYNDSALTEFPYSSVLESIGRDSFHGCSGLTDATIASSCTWIGDEAFFDCTGLEKVVMEGSTPPALGGDFVFWKIDSNAPSGVSQLDIDIEVPCDAVNTYKTAPRWSDYADRITCKTTPFEEQYLTFVAEANNCTIQAVDAHSNIFQYSTDNGTTWNNLANNQSTTAVNSGETIMFKASGLTVDSSDGIGTLKPSVRASVQGNIMSLVYGDNFTGQTTMNNYQFRGLFYSCANITSAGNLVLPATALTLYCYRSMFTGCSGLTTAPELPATTLADYCYSYMFNGCTSLTTSPELPATTLAQYCYEYMFRNCTNLNYIKCLATNTPFQSTNHWVEGVAASGTFVKDENMDWGPNNNSGIPSGWTVQDAD